MNAPQWVEVTPDQAKIWLKDNEDNRSLRETAITRYTEDMLAGRWSASNDMISFSTTGRLLNGQHRLTSVVRSGVTVGMWVVEGMDEDAFKFMDRGLGRTYADVLKSKGEFNPVQLSATLSRGVTYDLIGSNSGWSCRQAGLNVSDTQREAYLLVNPDIRNSVAKWANPVAARGAKCPQSILAFSHYLIAQQAGAYFADLFLNQLTTQDREPAQGTIRSVIRRLDHDCSGTGADNLRLALILTAWNAWAKNRELTVIRIYPDFRSEKLKVTGSVTR